MPILSHSSEVESHEAKEKQKLSRRGANEKLSAYRQRLSNSTTYAGHLSSLVYGKIKSLWSAQASTFNLGLNQLAGRTNFKFLACSLKINVKFPSNVLCV